MANVFQRRQAKLAKLRAKQHQASLKKEEVVDKIVEIVESGVEDYLQGKAVDFDEEFVEVVPKKKKGLNALLKKSKKKKIKVNPK